MTRVPHPRPPLPLRLCLCFLPVVAVLGATLANAASIGGIEPGKSTRAKIEDQLGAPTKEIRAESVCEYQGSRLGCSRIVVRYERGGNIADSVQFHFTSPAPPAQLTQALKLREPQHTEVRDGLVQYFSPQNVVFHHSGEAKDSPVACMELMSPRAFAAAKAASEERAALERARATTANVEGTSWIGVETKFAENKDSPDDFSLRGLPPRRGVKVQQLLDKDAPASEKLLVGDIVYEINGRMIQSQRDFTDITAKLPIGKEASFWTFREGKHREVKLAPAAYPRWRLLFVEGRSLQDSKKFDEAIRRYSLAIQLKPDYLDAYVWRGFAHEGMGQLEKAVQDWREAIEVNPKHHWPHNLVGLHHLNAGRYKEAIKNLDEALRISPRYSAALGNRGLAYYRLGQYEKAIDDLTQRIQTRPAEDWGYRLRGAAYQRLGQHEQAIRDFGEAIRRNAKSGYAYAKRGDSHARMRKFESAVEDYDHALRLNPEDKGLYYQRGWMYCEMGNHVRALADLDQAVKLDRNYADAYNRRGIAYYKQGQTEQAVRDYKDALRINPRHTPAQFNLGLAYRRLKQYEQAIRSFDEAVRFTPDYAEAWLWKGYCNGRLRNYDRAVESYNKAISIDPRYAHAYRERSWAHHDSGNERRAKEDSVTAFDLEPILKLEVSPQRAVPKTTISFVVEYPKLPTKMTVQEKWMLLKGGEPQMWGEKKAKFILEPGKFIHKVPYKIPSRMHPGEYTLRVRVSLSGWNPFKRPKEHERTTTFEVTK